MMPRTQSFGCEASSFFCWGRVGLAEYDEMKSMQTPIRSSWLIRSTSLGMVLLVSGLASAQWQTVWQAGAAGRGWPIDGVGGGPDVDFVQEAGTNPPPGDPNSPAVNQQADDDYYFAGVYPNPPVGVGAVANDEIAFERAFSGIDNDLRIHFNLPATLDPRDNFRFSFEANNLHEDAAVNPDPRYGIEVSVNGTLVMPEMIITPSELNTVFTTAEFTAADAGMIGGPGVDNVLSLTGINYNAEGGGNWMGMDYHHLEMNPIPEPGSLAMMLSGLIWFVPFVCYERGNGKRRRR